MKKLTLLIIITLGICTSNLYAQNIAFKAGWKTGETFSYYLFRNKYNPLNKDYIKNKDTVVVNFKVLKVSSKGIDVEMRHSYNKLSPSPFPQQGLKNVIKQVKQTPIVLSLDSTGKFLSIKNWKEVKSRCNKKLSEGKANAMAKDKDMWDYWKTKVKTEEQIEQFFIKDIEFFFMIYGSVLKRNRTIDYEDQMISPYGDILPAKTQLVIADDSVNNALVSVKFYTLPDGMKCGDLIKKYREMAREQEDDPDAIPDIALFDLQDYYEFLHNTKTSKHSYCTYLRYLKTGSKKLVEEWQFKLVD